VPPGYKGPQQNNVNTSIETVNTIYLYSKSDRQSVLSPNPAGYPLPLQPQPVLRRAAYITGLSEVEIRNAVQSLNNSMNPILLAFLSSGNSNSPILSRIFLHKGGDKIAIANNLHEQIVSVYTVPSIGAGWAWFTDSKLGREGYFLTGTSSASAIWHVNGIEIDAFGNPIISLNPLKLVGGMPTLSLAQVEDSLVRSEIERQYQELQNAIISHGYRSIITYTRNITEAIVGILLSNITGKKQAGDLGNVLKSVSELRAKSKVELAGFPDLIYHLAHKIRLLHARTHVDRTKKQGRQIDPYLAISCIEDLKEILREGNFAKA